MDWSKTKTIFIITFLILNLFLAYQFIQKRNSSQLDVILETTIEEQLEANGITYIELPKEITKAAYLSGKSKIFNDQELKKLSNQKAVITNQSILEVSFVKPILIPNPKDQYFLNDFIKRNIISGENYSFWKFDEKTKEILFFQKYNGKVIYKNASSMLVLHLNENNEIVSYKQTLLHDLEEYEKQEIVPAIKAIETLYRKDHLKPGDHVTNIELGYYALVQFTASQVLTPTWRIVVNGKQDYYVNAFEGQVINEEN
ncbi:two-component system regulatory protein YycI [Bacillus alveayuensis]|uniref:two-component system regulatory protein YycI n=1 Tax=Aeribacillus alveayuensis TaxID=279215 RepID=UPI0005CD2701|nr:two-component system regulatory protein YycI [Bacillus alveayuensis]